jgi:hypothetical protein
MCTVPAEQTIASQLFFSLFLRPSFLFLLSRTIFTGMFCLLVTLLTFALALSTVHAGVCPARSGGSGESGNSNGNYGSDNGYNGGKGGYPATVTGTGGTSTAHYSASTGTSTLIGSSSGSTGTSSGNSSTSTGSSSGNSSACAATTFNYGTDKVRGTNLGGWLRGYSSYTRHCEA